MKRLTHKAARYSRFMRGAAMTEMLVTLPALLILGLGTLQSALVYNAKTTVTYATFEAARKGATTHAQRTPMLQEFGLRVAPLFGGDGSPQRAVQAMTRGATEALNPLVTRIDIINPSSEAFDDFGEDNLASGKREIPNSHLRHRDANDIGATSYVNVQDANLLKIKTTYGYRLNVPLIDRLLPAILLRIDPQNTQYYSQKRIPVTAVATVRMQSSAWEDGNLNTDGSNSGSGSVPNGDPGEGTAPGGSGNAGDTGDTASDPDDGQGGNDNEIIVDVDNDTGTSNGTDPANGFVSSTGSTAESSTCRLDNSCDATQGYPAMCRVPVDYYNNPDNSLFGDLPTFESSPVDNTNQKIAGRNEGAPDTLASNLMALPSLGVGNPIHVVTGNKFQAETDLAALPGPLSVRFVRHYNSQSHYKGSLGHGWRHSYHVSINPTSDGYRVLQADGRGVYFKRRDDAGSYHAALLTDGWLVVKEDVIVWHWKNGQTLYFNMRGQLNRIVDAQQNEVSLQYTDHKRLLLVRDPSGRELTFNYYSNGRLKSVLDPIGKLTRYRYDRVGNLEIVTYADNTQRRYHYEDSYDSHNLTGITDQRGNRFATYRYDKQDRAVASEHAGGVGRVSLEFARNKTLVTDALGKESTYFTTMRQGIAVVTRIDGPGCSDCGRGDVQYEYNKALQLTKIMAKDGSGLLYDYDELGRLRAAQTRRRDGTQRLIAKLQYLNDSNRMTHIARPSVNPQGQRIVTVAYNADGQPIKIKESGFEPTPAGGYRPIERSQAFNYEEGKLLTVDGYRKDVDDITKLQWDTDKSLQAIQLPDGGEQRLLSRDAYGRLKKWQIGELKAQHVKYDEMGRISEVGNANGVLAYTYTADGRLETIDHGKVKVTFEYDAAGRLISEGDGNQTKQFQWNAANQIVQKRWLNAKDKPISTLSYRYDKSGSLVTLLNQSGQIVKRFPADDGRKKTRTQSSPPELHATNPIRKVTDARGNTTRYGSDDFGRTVFTDNPDTGLTKYTYDNAGNLRSKTESTGAKARFDYDASNMLQRAILPDETTEYTWRPETTNQIEQIHSSNSTERREYGTEGRLTKLVRNVMGKKYVTRYSYDAQGRLQTKLLPGGKKLRYSYWKQGEQAGNLRKVEQLRLFKRTPLVTLKAPKVEDASRSQSIQYGNGVNSRISYAGKRLTRLQVDGLHDFSYHYNRSGYITGIDDGKKAYQRFRYNKNGQLDFAVTPSALYGYRYDTNGNRTRKVVNGIPIAYRYATKSNRLASITLGHNPLVLRNAVLRKNYGLPFKPLQQLPEMQALTNYRASGEVETLGKLRMQYNANGQPEELYIADELVARYTYNSRAERIAKTIYDKHGKIGEQFHYLYDNSRLVYEGSATGDYARHYVYVNGKLYTIMQGKRRYAIHNNHLGAPIAVTDRNQQVIWEAEYAPYGRALINEDPDQDGESFTLSVRLPGQYEDAESGLHYNYYRFYDPDSGRYLSSDPLGLRAGVNTYAYVGGNPVNFVDPKGLLLFAFDGTGNTDNQQELNNDNATISNVVRFRDSYQAPVDSSGNATEIATAAGNHWYYMTGPGRTDAGSGINPFNEDLDSALAGSMGRRVLAMTNYLFDYLDLMKEQDKSSTEINIDIVGFSRGAAEARIFANVVDTFMSGGAISFSGLSASPNPRGQSSNAVNRAWNRSDAALDFMESSCVKLNLNFLGLFDTVPHYGRDQTNDLSELSLGIPSSVKHVAHAVAANEHREAFAGVSIHDSAATANSANRVELGFLGAHSDIGGGFGEGDLSDVAFMWMVEQARTGASVRTDRDLIERREWDVVKDPVVHDSIGVVTDGNWTPSWLDAYFRFGGPDREFRYMNNQTVDQKNWAGNAVGGGDSLTSAVAAGYFDRQFTGWEICDEPDTACVRKALDRQDNRTLVGAVRIDQAPTSSGAQSVYQDWLVEHYGLNIEINQEDLNQSVAP